MARRGEITGRKPRATADRAKRHKVPRPPVPPAVFSIATFCIAHHISEAFYFKLQSESLGPREMRLGSRVFITFESAAAWRAEREAATVTAGEAAE